MSSRAYKAVATNIIDAVEKRISQNIHMGNFNPVTVKLSGRTLKEMLGLERLKTITRSRLIKTLEEAEYSVENATDEEGIVITVNVASRYCTFDSYDALLESLI